MARPRRQNFVVTVVTVIFSSILLNAYFLWRSHQCSHQCSYHCSHQSRPLSPGWESRTQYEGMLRVMQLFEMERKVEHQVRDEFVDKIWNCMKTEFTVLTGTRGERSLISNVQARSSTSTRHQQSVSLARKSLPPHSNDDKGGNVSRTLRFDDYPYVSDHAEACANNNISIIIASPSSPKNFDRRRKMRLGNVGQFASNPQNRAKLLFFVGMPTDSTHQRAKEIQDKLNEEQSKFQDIVQSTFLDTYKNITKKGFLLPKWVSTFCHRAEIVLRIDDDVDANVSAMVSAVREMHQKLPHFMLGVWRENVNPGRKKLARNYLSFEEYPYQTLPPFLLGGSMGYPIETAKLIFKACHGVSPKIWLDDVWLTAICARKAAVPIFDCPAFYFMHAGKRKFGYILPR